MDNPFTLTFGKEPLSIINRDYEINEVYESFISPNPDSHTFLITGVRGSGKTVFMTSIANTLKKDRNWIICDLSSDFDLIKSLTANLNSKKEVFNIIKNAKINVSILGFEIGLENQMQANDVAVYLDKILSELTKKGKRVLVTIDEVVSNKNVREFVSLFQIFLRKEYNIFLLMTGLYENINCLQDEKTLTFLYRAPRIAMGPISEIEIANNYEKILGVDKSTSKEMAKLTKGYAYAYQTLGFLCFKYKKSYKDILDKFDQHLWKYVYEKLWAKLSAIDRKIVNVIANDINKVEKIRVELGMNSNTFTVYRKRLIKKGIIYCPQYGYLEFILPRFKEFVLDMYC